MDLADLVILLEIAIVAFGLTTLGLLFLFLKEVYFGNSVEEVWQGWDVPGIKHGDSSDAIRLRDEDSGRSVENEEAKEVKVRQVRRMVSDI